MRIIKSIFILVFTMFLFGCTKYENLNEFNYIKINIPKYENKIFHGIVKSSNNANLSFQTEGKITYFPFADGDFIKKGQTIARLDVETKAQTIAKIEKEIYRCASETGGLIIKTERDTFIYIFEKQYLI